MTALFDLAGGDATLPKTLSGFGSSLRPVLAAAYRLLLSHSSLLSLRASDLVGALAGSPFRQLPQAPGCWPLLGLLPQMCNDGLYSSTMATLFELAEACGLSASSVGTIPILYLRDPAVIRQVFVANADRVTRFGPDGRGPFGINQRLIGYTAATADGPDWHRWRRGFLRHYNGPAGLRNAFPALLRITRRHVQRMLDRRSGDLRRAMEAYAIDSAWHLALGLDDMSAHADELPFTPLAPRPAQPAVRQVLPRAGCGRARHSGPH
ncbi:hypothetical protein CDD83_10243 [Cordyceps sp. RAO-2017]|nr:hypothetical protein CDD83_10243 [Cordyceps sp. RAO-2017]